MLGPTGKRILLIVHILFNSVWTGGLSAILLLLLIKTETAPEQVIALDHAVFRIHDAIVMNIGFGVVVTGFLFSLFTRWGFFDFTWVIIKWIGLLFLFTLITAFLAPAVNGMAALSDLHGTAALHDPEYRFYHVRTFRVIVILIVTIAALVGLSVFKPWGPRRKPVNVKRARVLTAGIVTGLLVAGAGVSQYVQLEHFRMMEVHDPDLRNLDDGEYVGSADLGVTYTVSVSVRDHRLAGASLLDEDPGHYTRLAEGILSRIISEQNVNVRAVTGATTSSKGLMLAVEAACRNP